MGRWTERDVRKAMAEFDRCFLHEGHMASGEFDDDGPGVGESDVEVEDEAAAVEVKVNETGTRDLSLTSGKVRDVRNGIKQDNAREGMGGLGSVAQSLKFDILERTSSAFRREGWQPERGEFGSTRFSLLFLDLSECCFFCFSCEDVNFGLIEVELSLGPTNWRDARCRV